MIIGPKYKIARRLGAPVFEKTQTQKYALRSERKLKNKGFSKPKSEYALQQNEKQKARFVYSISEKQFSGYVKSSLAKKSSNKSQVIFESLEMRLDNIIYRIGLGKTRLGSRQIASHGHILINGKRVTIPSMRLRVGDKISIREGSKNKSIFSNYEGKTGTLPSWIKFNTDKSWEITGVPQYVQSENMFDLNSVIEFYSR